MKQKNKTGIELNLFQIAALATAFKKESITIQRWAKKGHYALKTPDAQKIIEQFKNQPQVPEII